MNQDNWLPTRHSLITRLKDWEDETGWHEFLDLYGRLIFHLARQSGLDPQESEDVVQETLIATAKAMPGFRYDPAVGSFKGWLFQLTRWKILDRFRQRQREQRTMGRHGANRAGTHTTEGLSDPDNGQLRQLWEREWQQSLLDAALQRLRSRINPRHYQIFDLHVLRQWEVDKVAESLEIPVAQVYLVKSRISQQLREEVDRLEKEML